jgi:nicotinamidase/pyrazinamidase
MEGKNAFLIVDPQVDFCPGGALAVAGGNDIMPVINRLIKGKFRGKPVFVSREKHPPVTSHFKKWGPHCVDGTPGCEFHPQLDLPHDAIVVSKGMGADEDAYSAFDAITDAGQTLEQALRSCGITDLYVAGLATDYCVKATVLDALARGFRVTVILDAIAAVNIHPDDGRLAREEMFAHKAEFIESDKL